LDGKELFFERSGVETPTVNSLLIMLNYNVSYVQEINMSREILIEKVEKMNQRSYVVKTAIDQASSGLRYHIFL
jgi:hypothetical protein